MIPLMKSSLLHERETLEALSTWLLSGPRKLSMGEKCAEFEREFAEWQGRKYAVLVNSGASANLALLQALMYYGRIDRGTRVGFSALTWATNVMPIAQLGMVPVPIDINPLTLNINEVQANNTQMDALFVTNALGLTCQLEVLKYQCSLNKIMLLEDNCESLGSVLSWGRAGNFGLASTFSFFVAHHMSTIEGGMVCTDNPELAEMLVMVRANGWDRNLTAEQQAKWRAKHKIADEFQAKYTFYAPAFNMRPTEITGFLGLQQMKYLDENIRIRQSMFMELEAVVKGNLALIPLDHHHMTTLSPFGFPVLCRTPELRAQYMARFGGAGVEIRPIIAGNITRQPFYMGPKAELPGADFIEDCGLYFGIYPELTASDMEVLKSCLKGW